MDALQIACALKWKPDLFVTADLRQAKARRQGWAFYKNLVNAVCHREFRSRAVWPIQQPNTSRVVERARSAYHALRWALGILRLGGSSSPKLAFIG